MTTSVPAETEVAISPEGYRDILKGLSLESINLTQWIAEIDHDLLQSEASQGVPVRLDVQQEVRHWEQKDGLLIFHQAYRLRGRSRRKQVLRIEAVYRVQYHTRHAVPAGFVKIFQQSTLVLTTYPYFRELTDSTTRRMGVPPITLPMVLMGMD